MNKFQKLYQMKHKPYRYLAQLAWRPSLHGALAFFCLFTSSPTAPGCLGGRCLPQVPLPLAVAMEDGDSPVRQSC